MTAAETSQEMPAKYRVDEVASFCTRDLLQLVRQEAAAVEEAGVLTDPVFDALRSAGLLALTVPEALGGGGADVLTGLRVVEEVSRADPSTGWTLMANMTATANAAGFLPARAVEHMFANGPPIFAGMLAPRGTAVPVGDGYLISGHYQFGSGIARAAWVGGGVFVRENGQVRRTESGGPDIRAFYVPRSGVELCGNWDVLGLTGTGSFDYEIREQHVDEDFGYTLADPQPTRSEPSYQLGFMPLGSLGHGAVGLGIGLRAFEELATIVASKRRPGMPGVIDQQLFLHDFTEKEASFQAARSFFFDMVQAALTSAERTGTSSAAQQRRLRQANTYATTVAADVVRWCYTWAGSDSLRNPSPLGRCLRDMSAATQHVLVDANTLVGIAPDLLADWKR
jgi:alkylation response protein AidB-like acyl-CoA dehydrogenase